MFNENGEDSMESAVKTEAPVVSNMRKLGKSTKCLNDAISELENKLRPVLSPVPTQKEDLENAPENPTTLASEITIFDNRIKDLVSIIDGILKRLEI